MEVPLAIAAVIAIAGAIGGSVMLIARWVGRPTTRPPTRRRRGFSREITYHLPSRLSQSVTTGYGLEPVDPAILAMAAVPLPGTDRGCFLEVVGETSYQPNLEVAFENAADREDTFHLFPEIGNAFDANAVMVLSSTRHPIGYLTREEAPRYRQALLALRGRGQIGSCRGRFVGGTDDKPTIGVWLDVIAATHLAEHFGVEYERVRH